MNSRWFVVLWTRVRLIECQRFVELGVHISAGISPDRRRHGRCFQSWQLAGGHVYHRWALLPHTSFLIFERVFSWGGGRKVEIVQLIWAPFTLQLQIILRGWGDVSHGKYCMVLREHLVEKHIKRKDPTLLVSSHRIHSLACSSSPKYYSRLRSVLPAFNLWSCLNLAVLCWI